MASIGFKLVPAFTNADIRKLVQKFADKHERKMELILIRAGEYFVKYARENGAYKDQTGNLRSSIGYVVSAYGKVIAKSAFDALPAKMHVSLFGSTPTVLSTRPEIIAVGTGGARKGEDFANKLVGMYPDHTMLFGVAGMEYAGYVEAIHSLDVITAASIKTQAYIRQTINSLKL